MIWDLASSSQILPFGILVSRIDAYVYRFKAGRRPIVSSEKTSTHLSYFVVMKNVPNLVVTTLLLNALWNSELDRAKNYNSSHGPQNLHEGPVLAASLHRGSVPNFDSGVFI